MKEQEQKEEQEQETHLYLIDGAAPEVAKKYFSTLSTNAIVDIINMLNYAAQLSWPNSIFNEVTISKDQLNSLRTMAPIKATDFLAENINKKHQDLDSDGAEKFATLTSILKQNLQNLLDYSTPPSILLENISALVTSKTAEKFGDTAGGWDKYTNNLLLVSNTTLLQQDHMKLLQEHNAKLLAASINLFMKNEITVEDFFQKQMNYLLNKYTTDLAAESTDDETNDSELKATDSAANNDDQNSSDSPRISQPLTPYIHLLNSNDNSNVNNIKNQTVTSSPKSDSPDTDNLNGVNTPPESDIATRKLHIERAMKNQFRLFPHRKETATDVIQMLTPNMNR